MRYLVTALLVFLFASIITPSVSAASGHGCASPVPPGIPGSPSPAPAVSGVIVINEVLLVPHSTWNCSEASGTYFVNNDTWLELYNTQNQPFNLYAAHAALDSGSTTNPYYFPFGAAIPAHGFLVLFPRTNALFASTATATLRLTIGGIAVDQVTVPQLGPDQSYARTSDGAASWQITSTPTIYATNISLQVTPTASTGVTPTASTGGTGSTGSGSPTAQASSGKVLVNGVQPPWNKLLFPTTTPTATHNVAPTTLSSPAPSNSGGLDLARRIALTLLCLALASTLFWCWRLFTSA